MLIIIITKNVWYQIYNKQISMEAQGGHHYLSKILAKYIQQKIITIMVQIQIKTEIYHLWDNIDNQPQKEKILKY